MVLISFEGKLGKGKTISMVQHGLKEKRKSIESGNDMNLYTNLKLYNLPLYSKMFNVKEFNYGTITDPRQIEKLTNSIVMMDELWSYLKAKIKTTALDQVLDEIILKSRHNDIKLLFTSQYLKQCHLWLRRVTDYRVFPVYNEFKQQVKCYVYEYDYLVHGEAKLGDFVYSYRYSAPFIMNFYNHKENIARSDDYKVKLYAKQK